MSDDDSTDPRLEVAEEEIRRNREHIKENVADIDRNRSDINENANDIEIAKRQAERNAGEIGSLDERLNRVERWKIEKEGALKIIALALGAVVTISAALLPFLVF